MTLGLLRESPTMTKQSFNSAIMLHSFVKKRRVFNNNIQYVCSFRTIIDITVCPLLVDRHLSYLFTPMHNDIEGKITYNNEFNLFSGKETRCKYTILSITYISS